MMALATGIVAFYVILGLALFVGSRRGFFHGALTFLAGLIIAINVAGFSAKKAEDRVITTESYRSFFCKAMVRKYHCKDVIKVLWVYRGTESNPTGIREASPDETPQFGCDCDTGGMVSIE